jgi:CheY-like chemotaxis protein
VRVLGRATGTLVDASILPSLREASIEEVAARVGEEIRRGLVDAAETGRDLKVPLGEGAEVLAAAWAAVARVRALFSERSGGRVRFSDRDLRAAPALLTLGAESGAHAATGGSPLAGRRVVVADDDAAVVQLFAQLLRDEGAYVTEASDGAEALRAARRERPDLVIGDVIMPGLDGFALCRELKRDPLLADVPVILISWKDDLLARMRELASGASGYLRKEASSAQIIAGVREVLAPRSRLEADLASSSEVRGNLEGTGVVALMRSVRRARPDARVTIRDAWNLFECELRDGRLAQLTRTASDGSFVRNERALPQLLGVSAGRFSVTAAEGPLKHALEGSLDEALARGARELGAQLDALSGAELERVERVVFDEDAQAALLDHVPPLVREVMRCLAEGERPSELWGRGVVERALLEPMLLDMAKRGVIRAVLGAQREDLVAAARAQRSRLPPTALGSPGSMLPPAPSPVISVLPGDRSELPHARELYGEELAQQEVVLTPIPPAPAVNLSGGHAEAARTPSAPAPEVSAALHEVAGGPERMSAKGRASEDSVMPTFADATAPGAVGDAVELAGGDAPESADAAANLVRETADVADAWLRELVEAADAPPAKSAGSAGAYARELADGPASEAAGVGGGTPRTSPDARGARAHEAASGTGLTPYEEAASATSIMPDSSIATRSPRQDAAVIASGTLQGSPAVASGMLPDSAVVASDTLAEAPIATGGALHEVGSGTLAESPIATGGALHEVGSDTLAESPVATGGALHDVGSGTLAKSPIATGGALQEIVASDALREGPAARDDLQESAAASGADDVEARGPGDAAAVGAADAAQASIEEAPPAQRAQESAAPHARDAEAGAQAELAEPAARAAEARRSSSDPRELDAGAAEARSSRGTLWAWTAAFVGLVAVGFVLDRARTPELAAPRVEAIGAARAGVEPEPLPAQPSAAEVTPAAPSEAPPALPALEPHAQPLLSGAEGGFEISDRIVDHGVEVAPEQALLVVEAKPGGEGAQLSLDGKPLGALPVKLGVSEGIHELAITRGDSVMYRFLAPRRGSTWLLREP